MTDPIKLPPMEIFDKGPWVWKGQEFTGAELDAAAFAKYRLAVEKATAELRAEAERLRVDAERFRSVVQSVAVTELHKLPGGDKCVCTRCELALEARAAIDAALKEPK
jgi:hypothetical protein